MQSTVKNIYLNSIIGFVLKVLLLILSFINRTIFINLLGSEYLGISGLYSNIINLLSLADLGIYTAFMFSLYKPLNDQNFVYINSLIRFFSKIYKFIGIIVILIGLCLTPFLKYLITSSNLTDGEFKNYFVLFVLNAGLSYFNVCKSTLLRADKKVYIVDIITSACTIATSFIQILFLLITNNYYSYIIVQIVFTIVLNLFLTLITNRKYPFLNKKNKVILPIENEVKNNIFKNIKSVLIYKIGGVIMTSTDNIIISIMLGTMIVGYYSNYGLILSTLTTFVGILINAILPNIGEVNAKGDPNELLSFFKLIVYVFNIIAIFISSTLICVFNDFIYLWIQDKNYVLSELDIFFITANFYIVCISNPLWMFRESTGLFNEVKYLLIIAAIINIILSIVLGNFLGLGGIVFATGISRLVTMFWLEPLILYKKVFKTSCIEYWKKYVLYIFLLLMVCLISYMLCNLLICTIFNFIIKVVICLVITTLFTIIFTFGTKEFKNIINFIKKRRKV